ncbi:MAG: succinate dehydrogenase cytochrome b subunit [Bdellovibrionales bacterium]|nr:succinate dehydrogenase cytochrome b subunit [Bdellovibrionales bacterium]
MDSQLLKSSIGMKFVMGLTGLVWSLFLLTHMAANLLVIFNPVAYNLYSYGLANNPLLYLAETGLVVFILAHIVNGVMLTFKNSEAKPQGYAVVAKNKGTPWYTRTMIYQGVLIAVFMVLHLITFKYGTHYETTIDGVKMRDLHRLVIEVFQKPGYVFWYFVCLITLCFHMSHGVASTFQSLGLHHPRFAEPLKKVGIVYAVIVALGFLALPFYVFVLHRA